MLDIDDARFTRYQYTGLTVGKYTVVYPQITCEAPDP
jgi:hypothetical protein